MNLKLHFTGNPKAVQSFRYTKSGMRYQPFNVTDWKNYIRLAAQQQLPPGFVILDSPLMVSAVFTFSAPRSWSKKKLSMLERGGRFYKTTKPDLTDNLMKGLIDAFSGIVWVQDQQICEVRSSKLYGMQASTLLEVFEIADLPPPEPVAETWDTLPLNF